MLRLLLVILCVIGGPGALAAQEHLFHGASGLPHGIPDFCARASNVARASGNWSDGAILGLLVTSHRAANGWQSSLVRPSR